VVSHCRSSSISCGSWSIGYSIILKPLNLTTLRLVYLSVKK